MPNRELSVHTFLSEGAVYAFSNVLARGLGLILLPVLARYLSPADYGAIELVAAAYALLNLLLPLEVTQGMARLQVEEKDDRGKAALASTAFWFTGATFGALVFVAWLVPDLASAALFGTRGEALLAEVVTLFMLQSALLYVVQNQLRWNLQSRTYAITNLAFVLVTASLTVGFVAIWEIGILGYFLAALAGSTFALALGLFLVEPRVVFRAAFDANRLRSMLSFSAPLVFSGLAVYLTAYADRWIVRFWLDLDSLGFYGVAFRIASVAGVVVTSLLMAVTPLVYQRHEDARTPEVLRRLLVYLLAAFLPAVGLLAALAEPLVQLLAGERFRGAAPAVGWLSLGVVLMVLYVFAPGMGLAKQTRRIALTNVIAASCNVMLALLLTPMLGIIGAAIAYVVGGLAMVSLYFLGSHRFYPIHYPFPAFGTALLATLALLVVFSALQLPLGWRLAIFVLTESPVVAVLLWSLRSAVPVTNHRRPAT
jgi:O-antigen/teichoic acid export membrane protein